MKFTMTRMTALATMVFASTGAQAVLTNSNTLSIQSDAVTGQDSSGNDIISSDGPLVDSFFTQGGAKTKDMLGTQYTFLYGGSDLTLTGATQSNMAAFRYYGASGDLATRGTGISILSASGDTASLDMSGLKWDWNSTSAVMGTGAWSSGYTNGIGNLTCTAGSGCAVDSAYTLQYTATIPPGDPSGIGDAKFYFELHGTVGAVPEASTYGMMLAGLGVIGVVVRLRKPASRSLHSLP